MIFFFSFFQPAFRVKQQFSALPEGNDDLFRSKIDKHYCLIGFIDHRILLRQFTFYNIINNPKLIQVNFLCVYIIFYLIIPLCVKYICYSLPELICLSTGKSF